MLRRSMPPLAPPPTPRRGACPAFRPRATVAAATLAAAALGLGVACRDPIELRAENPVASATLAASALTGTAPNTRSALRLREMPAAVSPEGNPDFDLGVDINPAGQAVFYPAGLVDRRAPRRVGLRRVSESYDSLARAPGGTYNADSAVAVAPGAVVVAQVSLSDLCIYSGSPYFYSKLVVDSVRLADRIVFLRVTTNPNCGFRSFAAGVPRN